MSAFQVFTKNVKIISTESIRYLLRLSENGFDGVLKKVNIISCENGNCLAELKVDKEHVNALNGLHGGLSATLVDALGSYALATHKTNVVVPSVSVDIHVSYLKGASLGDDIIIDAKAKKVGKNLAFLTCEIKNKATGDLLVNGNLTKSFIHLKD